LNPCMRSSIIKKELEKDYAAASSEYLARFRQDLEAYVSQEIVEACVIPAGGCCPESRMSNITPSLIRAGEEGILLLLRSHIKGAPLRRL